MPNFEKYVNEIINYIDVGKIPSFDQEEQEIIHHPYKEQKIMIRVKCINLYNICVIRKIYP